MMKKAAAFFLGCVTVLLLMETLLYFAAAPYSAASDSGAKAPRSGEKVLLCAGDSFVRGIGVPEGRGFPEQLGAMLRAGGHTGWTVVNTGTPGENTTQILERLRKDARRLRPAVIVMLGGMINEGNYYGYFAHSKRNAFLASLANRLSGIRTLKLFTVAAALDRNTRRQPAPPQPADDTPPGREFQEGRRAAEALLLEGRYAGAAEILGALSRKAPDSFSLRKRLAEALAWNGKYAEAAQSYSAALALRQDMATAWELGRLYDMQLADHAAAFRTWKRSIEADPAPQGGRNFCFEGLFSLLPNEKAAALHPEIRAFLAKTAEKLPPDNAAFIRDALQGGSRAAANRWKEADFEAMIDLAEELGAGFLLLNYPETAPGGPLIERIAEKRGVPLVDNKREFDRLLKSRSRGELFATDNSHCSEEGYRVIAANVYRKLEELRLLDAAASR
ncbi:MAG: GDSL-type esterase/lipase family protein [Elusimicrobiales bacterium]|nr:GDSL-type esterase/lipase family protein [Elusimicrobiales bacterium]